MVSADTSTYQTRFPLCADCGLMFTAASLEDGLCPKCRMGHSTNWYAVFWTMVLLTAVLGVFLYPRTSPAATQSNAWQRCYVHGDWRETPYCIAAARDMEQ